MSEDAKLVELLYERSLLGLFLERPEIQQLLHDYPPEKFPEGAIVFSEGAAATHLGIMCEGQGTLTTAGPNGDHIRLGRLTPYRSGNLYAIIRGMNYQYSLVMSEASQVMTIPWEILKPAFLSKPKLEVYLDLMTSSNVTRQIKREIDDLGCSKDFRIEIIGSLVRQEILPENWIAHQGEVSDFAFFLIEGAAQAFQKSKNNSASSLWAMSKNTWELWAECLDGLKSKYSFRTDLNSQIFKIQKTRLDEIRTKFPEDFAKYDKWIRKSIEEPLTDNDHNVEIDSLSDLFPKLERTQSKTSKYPHVFQNDQMDCGPACLTMISKFYGKNTSIQFWRDKVFTNQEGTTLFDLAKATERNGFISHGIGIDTLSEIETNLLPCIAVRDYHYLVIYEILKDELIVGDPGIGVITMTHEKFLENFEHAILLLKPNDDFQKLPTVKQGISHYLGLFEGLRKEIFFILACSGILVLFSLFPPFLSQIIIDEVLSKKDMKLLAIVLGGAVLVVICQALSTWLRGYYIYFLTAKFDFRSNSAFLKKLFSLPYTFFATRHVGDFTRRLSELERLRSFFSSVLIGTLLDMSVLLLYGVVLFLYSPVVALAGFIGAPATLLLAHFFSIKLRTKYTDIFNSRSKQESLLTDLVKGAGTVKLLNSEVASRWRFEERLTKTLKAQYSYAILGEGISSFTDAYTQLLKYGLMWFSAYWGVKGALSPGQVIAISMLVGQIVDPFRNLSHNWASIQEMKTILSRLDDVFLASSEETANKKGIAKAKLVGEIEFQDVWFRYGGDSSDWILRGCSFKIKRGQHVAIVGPSGCGKSTVAHLIARMYEPTQGHILIDGRDYREYDINWLRSQIGLLQQEPVLFYGTVAENIAFGKPTFSDKDVINAAKMSDAHDFIVKKSLGYDYKISYSGIGLSGGQKQRLALARTLYAEPSLIILDEATSMLDGISEAIMLKNIYSNFKGTTILSIAHRYSTARTSDFALVMENGRVVNFGSHENLEAEEGLYTQLFGIRARRVA
jgi:subfamily B ATP-binding cassette protein HlyB/CyaB